MEKPEEMTDGELCKVLRQYARTATGAEDTELSERRQKALEYYKGEVNDVPTEDGWSEITSRDLSEVMNWILPSLMRVFANSDMIAEFEPKTADPMHRQAAKEATDYLNYLFMCECDGYQVLYNSIFEGLLYGNGFVKVWYDPTPEYDVDDYTGLTEEEYLNLTSPDNVEILQETQNIEVEMVEGVGPDGVPVFEQAEVVYYDIKIRIEKSKGRVRVISVPPEEVVIEEGSVSTAKAGYVAHKYKDTRGNLVKAWEEENPDAMEIIKRASKGATLELNGEYLERHDENEPIFENAREDWASEEIDVWEHYIRIDYDGDGWPEWRKVVTVGEMNERDILANDEWGDDHSISDLVPDPRPHRWDGRMLLDDLEDIQQQKTLLTRAINDNIALVNHPEKVASTNIENRDVVANPRPGSVAYVPGDVRAAMAYNVTPYIGQQAFQVIAYYDEQRERRTGVSRQSMALDPDALQNQTATAAQIQETASQARNEIRARNIAQYGGVTELFRRLYRLVRRHTPYEMTVKTGNGRYTTINPRLWPADMDVVVTVGLGSGSRDKDLNTLNAISMKQEQIMGQLGLQNPFVSLEQYSHTLHKLTETAGARNPEAFFNMVTPDAAKQFFQAQAQQPNPEAQKAQAEMQKAQMEMQMKAQQSQIDAQIKEKEIAQKVAIQRAESEQKLQLERERMAADIQNMRDKYQLEGELARQKAAQEFELKREEMAIEAELTREANQMNAAMNAQKAADTNIQRQAGE